MSSGTTFFFVSASIVGANCAVDEVEEVQVTDPHHAGDDVDPARDRLDEEVIHASFLPCVHQPPTTRGGRQGDSRQNCRCLGGASGRCQGSGAGYRLAACACESRPAMQSIATRVSPMIAEKAGS